MKREYRLLLKHSDICFSSEDSYDPLEIRIFDLVPSERDFEKTLDIIKMD